MTTDHRAAFHYFGAHSGACVSYTDPMPCQIHAEDIALSLSHQYRGLGHDSTTIAQHCLITGFLTLDARDALPPQDHAAAIAYALVHDGAEAYTGDIPMPLKTTIRDMWRLTQDPAHDSVPDPLKAIEAKLDQAIWRALEIEPPTEAVRKCVKNHDGQAISLEMRDVMSQARHQTFLDSGYSFQKPRADVRIVVLHPEIAQSHFDEALALIPRFAHFLSDPKKAGALHLRLRHLAGLAPC